MQERTSAARDSTAAAQAAQDALAVQTALAQRVREAQAAGFKVCCESISLGFL